MEKDNNQVAHMTEMLSQLTEDNLSFIDFDRHRQWLEQMAADLPQMHRASEELAVLRGDYIERIAGMTKAIAAVERRRDLLERALAYVGKLPTMSVGDLVEQYRLTSARFRDAFPTSFGQLRPHRRTLRTEAGSTTDMTSRD